MLGIPAVNTGDNIPCLLPASDLGVPGHNKINCTDRLESYAGGKVEQLGAEGGIHLKT